MEAQVATAEAKASSVTAQDAAHATGIGLSLPSLRGKSSSSASGDDAVSSNESALNSGAEAYSAANRVIGVFQQNDSRNGQGGSENDQPDGSSDSRTIILTRSGSTELSLITIGSNPAGSDQAAPETSTGILMKTGAAAATSATGAAAGDGVARSETLALTTKTTLRPADPAEAAPAIGQLLSRISGNMSVTDPADLKAGKAVLKNIAEMLEESGIPFDINSLQFANDYDRQFWITAFNYFNADLPPPSYDDLIHLSVEAAGAVPFSVLELRSVARAMTQDDASSRDGEARRPRMKFAEERDPALWPAPQDNVPHN